MCGVKQEERAIIDEFCGNPVGEGALEEMVDGSPALVSSSEGDCCADIKKMPRQPRSLVSRSFMEYQKLASFNLRCASSRARAFLAKASLASNKDKVPQTRLICF